MWPANLPRNPPFPPRPIPSSPSAAAYEAPAVTEKVNDGPNLHLVFTNLVSLPLSELIQHWNNRDDVQVTLNLDDLSKIVLHRKENDISPPSRTTQ